MNVHNVVITEPHPCRRGFFRRIYALVEVRNAGAYWTWRQVDQHGSPLTDADSAFDSEDAALNDAVRRLNGEAVTV